MYKVGDKAFIEVEILDLDEESWARVISPDVVITQYLDLDIKTKDLTPSPIAKIKTLRDRAKTQEQMYRISHTEDGQVLFRLWAAERKAYEKALEILGGVR